jgi:hypothetical protein
MSEGRLMSVDSRLVKDVLVRELLRRAEGHAEQGAGRHLAGEHSAMVRLGYCARLAEADLFEPARAPLPGLAERMAKEATTDVSRELASAEPSDRPDPEDDVASWRVPGPGGHVRHYVAMLAAERLAPDDDPAQAKRAFMYGFFVRCCEEVR